jgi:hypothetical protein
LVVELDGFEFHRGRDTFARDRARETDLQSRASGSSAFTHRQLKDSRREVQRRLRALLSGEPLRRRSARRVEASR